MFGFAETQKQMQNLLLETREYVGLQKKALLVETRDKLSVLLSSLAIAVVCLLLGGMVLLFFSFFLAYILGQALGNTALGFACVTAFVLLLLIIFWNMRTRWVIRPITSMLHALFTVDNQPLAGEEVTQQLHESQTRMSENFSQLLHTGKAPANKAEAVSSWISRGVAAYEGVRIGISIIRALGNVFGRRRRR